MHNILVVMPTPTPLTACLLALSARGGSDDPLARHRIGFWFGSYTSKISVDCELTFLYLARMTRYIWLPGETVKDRLTDRERTVYAAIKYACFAGLAGILVSVFVFSWLSPTWWIILIALLINIPTWIFGLALQTDTRVVHGVSWLQKEMQNQ